VNQWKFIDGRNNHADIAPITGVKKSDIWLRIPDNTWSDSSEANWEIPLHVY
jgi:hypothetical protein